MARAEILSLQHRLKSQEEIFDQEKRALQSSSDKSRDEVRVFQLFKSHFFVILPHRPSPSEAISSIALLSCNHANLSCRRSSLNWSDSLRMMLNNRNECAKRTPSSNRRGLHLKIVCFFKGYLTLVCLCHAHRKQWEVQRQRFVRTCQMLKLQAMTMRGEMDRLRELVIESLSADQFEQRPFFAELRRLESKKNAQIFDRVQKMKSEAEKRIVEWGSGHSLLLTRLFLTLVW